MTSRHAVRAHTNIALVKYWGKENDELIIPLTGSISMTLDALYTETQVTFNENFTEDVFYLDDEKQSGKSLDKVIGIIDLVREQAGIACKAEVISYNHVPTAAGLASSASGIAALAAATSRAAGLDLSDIELSRLARRGSGSASRSIYGGLVEWEKGHDDKTSFAKQIDPADWGLGMFVIVNNRSKKKMSSRQGMKQTVDTSAYINAWIETTTQDIMDMKDAINARDFVAMGEITERSAYKMHATTMGAEPPFTYLEPASLEGLTFVRKLREKGLLAYATMDAGPNVKILVQSKDRQAIEDALIEAFGRDKIIYSEVGSGIQDIECFEGAQ